MADIDIVVIRTVGFSKEERQELANLFIDMSRVGMVLKPTDHVRIVHADGNFQKSVKLIELVKAPGA